MNPSKIATLTVAIPTYKRVEALEKTVREVLRQLNAENDRLLIIDNDPDGSGAKRLQNYASDPRVRIIRNACNIGGNANIMRCIECADTEYVWLLGDDDEVAGNALAVIHHDIEEHALPAHINYALRDKTRAAAVVRNTLREYIGSIGLLNDFWLISNWVYHVPTAKRQLVYALNLLSSCAPHIVLAFGSLKYERARGVISPHQVVIGHAFERSDGGWSILNFCLLRGTLFNFEMSSWERKILRNKMADLMPVLRHCAFMLALKAVASKDGRGAREQYAQIYFTNFSGCGRFGLWAQYQLFSLLLHCPHLLIKIVKVTKGIAFYEKWRQYDHASRM